MATHVSPRRSKSRREAAVKPLSFELLIRSSSVQTVNTWSGELSPPKILDKLDMMEEAPVARKPRRKIPKADGRLPPIHKELKNDKYKPRITLYGKRILEELSTSEGKPPVLLIPNSYHYPRDEEFEEEPQLNSISSPTWIREIHFDSNLKPLCQVVQHSSATFWPEVPAGAVASLKIPLSPKAVPKELSKLVPPSADMSAVGLFVSDEPPIFSGTKKLRLPAAELLDRSTVQKIITEILPQTSGVNFGKDARDLLIECCVEFITLISSEANEISEKEAKKTIACEHITKALEQLGFVEYVEDILEVASEHKEQLKGREKKANKLEASGMSTEQLLALQEAAFKEAAERHN